jgi:hypothetical protein
MCNGHQLMTEGQKKDGFIGGKKTTTFIATCCLLLAYFWLLSSFPSSLVLPYL